MDFIPFKIRRRILDQIGRIKSAGKQKIFCIGKNKTGTTSLKTAMKELGYVVGYQRHAELLVREWAQRDFRKLTTYCKSAQFFQDVPFSYPYTFIAMDQAFKGSRFILTVRDCPEQWYESIVSFHSKLYGKNGRVPTKEDLQEAVYIYKGRPWETRVLRGTTYNDEPYNKDRLIGDYIKHNENVADYFRHRPDDLLILNVADKDAYQKLCNFLGVKSKQKNFPWKNKTEDIDIRWKVSMHRSE